MMKHKRVIAFMLAGMMVLSQAPVYSADEWIEDDIAVELQDEWVEDEPIESVSEVVFDEAEESEVAEEFTEAVEESSDYLHGSTGNDYNGMYYEINDNEVTITGVVPDIHYKDNGRVDFEDTCWLTQAIIPETIDGLPVTTIGKSAFSKCINLQSVTFPTSLDKIECAAFKNCVALDRISIDHDIVTGSLMGASSGWAGAFYGCSSLRTITFGEDVTTIPQGLFHGCDGLAEIEIPSGVKTIEKAAFKDCVNLTKVTLPEGLKIIDGDAVNDLGAFQGCTCLSIINLPDSLETLGIGAFKNCKQLASINIPGDISTNGTMGASSGWAGAFYGCSSLRTITFGEDVTTIPRGLFHGCNGLVEIEIPSGVKTIEKAAFKDCKNLTTVTLPEGLKKIDGDAVNDLGAFQGCTCLSTITLPDSLETLGIGAFKNCTQLPSINIPGDMATHSSMGSSSAWAGAFYGCSSLRSIIFSEDVTVIPRGLFHGCDGLEEIEIPSGVKTIEKAAFKDCKNLTTVTLPEGLKKIDGDAVNDLGAFRGCTSLTIITLPDSLETLGIGAFKNCTQLASINIPGDITTNGMMGANSAWAGAFYGCSSLRSITFGVGVTTIPQGLFYGCTGLEEIELPDTITNIAQYAFKDCTNLTAIMIPASVKNIASDSFKNRNESLVIMGYSGSYAEQYADSKSITFIPIINYRVSLNDKAITVYQNEYENNSDETNYILSKGTSVQITMDTGANTLTTDEFGVAKLLNAAVSNIQNVIISKPEYVSRTISWSKISNTNAVYLQKESKKHPVISAVWFGDTDIMNETAYYYLTNQKETTVEVEVKWDHASAKRLSLVQDSGTYRKVDLNLDGSVKSIVLTEHFDLAQPIYIEAEDADKVVTRRKLLNRINNDSDIIGNISFLAPGKAGVELGDDAGILFKGSKFNLNFDIIKNLNVPYSLVCEDGKIYGAIGIEPLGHGHEDVNYKDGRSKDYTKDVKTVVSKIKEFKNGVESKNEKKSKSILEGIKKNWKEGTKEKVSIGYDYDINVLGFVEATFDENNHIRWLDGGIVVYGSYSNEKDWNNVVVIGVIPVPWYLSVKFESELAAKFNLFQSSYVEGYTDDMAIDAEVSLTGGIGAGVKKVISGGGELKGSLSPHVTFNTSGSGSFWGDLALKAYVRANLLGFEVKSEDLFEKVGIKLEKKDLWRLYFKNSASKNASVPEKNNVTPETDGETKELSQEELVQLFIELQEELNTAIYDTENYKAEDLTYFEGGSTFVANNESETEIADNGVETECLVDNVYSYSSAKLAKLVDGSQIAVWLSCPDDNANHVYVYYSVEENGMWTEPQILHEDGTPDFNPVLMSANDDFFIAWQNADMEFDYSSITLEEAASHYDISAAKIWKNDKGVWTSQIRDFRMPGFDSLPAISAEDDFAVVAWVNNPQNEIFSTGQNNNIMIAKFGNGFWSEPDLRYEGLPSIDSLAVNGVLSPSIVYCLSSTENEEGETQTAIYKNGELILQDTATLSGVSYQNNELFWYQDGNISGENFAINMEEIPTDYYQVINNSAIGKKMLVYLDTSDARSQIRAAVHDDMTNSWGSSIVLVDTDEYIQNFSAVADESGVITVLYNGIEVNDDENDNAQFGKATIKKVSVPAFSDIELTSLYTSQDINFIYPEISGIIHNNGLTTVKKFKTIFFSADDTETPICSRVFSTNIEPGESKEFRVHFLDRRETMEKVYNVECVLVEDNMLSTETVLSNNKKTVAIKNENLVLQDLRWGKKADGSFVILADIVNEGNNTRNNITIEAHKDTLSGEVLASAIVDEVRSGGITTAVLELDAQNARSLYYVSIAESGDDLREDDYDFIRIGDIRTNMDKCKDALSDPATTISELVSLIENVNKQDMLFGEGSDLLSRVDQAIEAKQSENPDIVNVIFPETGSADGSVSDVIIEGGVAETVKALEKTITDGSVTGNADQYKMSVDVAIKEIVEGVYTLSVESVLKSDEAVSNEYCDVSGLDTVPVKISCTLSSELIGKELWVYKGTGKNIVPEYYFTYDEESGRLTLIKDNCSEYTISSHPLVKAELDHGTHNIVEEIRNKVEATCTTYGYTGDKYCSVCDELLEEGTSYINEHTVVIDDAVAPSGNLTGLTEGSHCSVCGTVLVAQQVIPKIDSESNAGGNSIKGFSDVQDPTHPYYKAIYWAADAGITKGYSDGTFGINRSCTRGEMMMFLWRYTGKPAPKTVSKSPFKDVPRTHTFYKAILWGSQKGITKGYPDGTFGINRNVSRGECMMFLWRLKGKPSPKAVAKAPFPDVPKSHVFYNAVLWGYQKKITTGFTSGKLKGKFGVNENCSRGQIVTFLYRAK